MPIGIPVIHKGWFCTQSGADWRPPFDRGRTHQDIDILEDLTRSDTATAVGRLDQVVTRLATMFATERVDKREGLGELFCLDQETGAIDVPFCGRFPHVAFTLWGKESKFCGCMLAEIFVEGEQNLLAGEDAVNSIILVQRKAQIFAEDADEYSRKAFV